MMTARAKHALELKAMLIRASKLKQKVISAFYKVLTRKLLFTEVKKRS